MKRRRNEIDERRVEELLTRLWRGMPTPSEDELLDISRSASAESSRVKPDARDAAEEFSVPGRRRRARSKESASRSCRT